MSASMVEQLLRAGASRLDDAGVERPRVEAEWLLADALQTTPLTMQLDHLPVAPEAAARYLDWIAERARGVPLQYVTGQAAFFGMMFDVQPGVFIPRPETEALVERIVQYLKPTHPDSAQPNRMRQVVDAGTGSGCIAAALAVALPACLVIGIEVSWFALLIAQRNLNRHGLLDRVRLVQGRWLEPIIGRVDVIVSNPPYVPTEQVDRLPLNVRQEPRVSLDGGIDGLRDVDRLLALAPDRLSAGGLLAMECGEEQAMPLCHRVAGLPWVATVQPWHDLAGRPRGLLVKRAE